MARPHGPTAGHDRLAGRFADRLAERRSARLASRSALPDPLPYPAELPIVGRKAELTAALVANQVLVVAGETGSGKSTQLPKICIEVGRGTSGMIGHTQPRRIAARSVAERVAEELGVALGGPVGYKVRFTDMLSEATVVKVMTDGVLLAELRTDPLLLNYDTLIIDEAHERSLNIDFILGYLKGLLPRRPDLKMVITSATIDTERFSAHFWGAPVVEVSGRMFPVEVRYRPLEDEDGTGAGTGSGTDQGADPVQAVCDAVAELRAEAQGTCSSSSPASVRSGTRRRRWQRQGWKGWTSCLFMLGSRLPNSTGCSSPTPGSASSCPATSPRLP